MTLHIMHTDDLNAEERFALMDAVSETLTAHGKRPASIKLVKVQQAGAIAQAQA